MEPRRTLLDISLSLALLYFSVWIYELCNYAAFYVVGASASLYFDGVLPVGVASISGAGAELLLVKPIQVALCCAAGGSIYYVARRARATASSLVAAALLSLFCASFYWEALSLVGPLPLALHEVTFSLLSLGGLFGLSRLDPSLKGLFW